MKASKFRLPGYSALVGSAVLLAGCSFFSTKQDAADASNQGFHAIASPDGALLPLPIEIADDISKISQGGQVAQSNGWQLGPAELQAGAKKRGPATAAGDDQAEVSDVTAETSDAATEDASEMTVHHKHAHARSYASSGEFGDHSVHHEGPAHDEKYTVKNGDTLMKISFAKYGSLFRWREILAANQGQVPDFNHLKQGTVLKIAGVDYVVIERNGKPYLIRLHDTLAKISDKVYGSAGYWKSIWRNNPQLIENPNKIYAGLTLYYREHPEEVRSGPHQTLGHHKPSTRLPKKMLAKAKLQNRDQTHEPTRDEEREPATAPTKPLQYELPAAPKAAPAEPIALPPTESGWEPATGPAVSVPGGDVSKLSN